MSVGNGCGESSNGMVRARVVAAARSKLANMGSAWSRLCWRGSREPLTAIARSRRTFDAGEIAAVFKGGRRTTFSARQDRRSGAAIDYENRRIKTAAQLDLRALHRVREQLVRLGAGIINQTRAFLLERVVSLVRVNG
jgi:hypothetical protein